MMLNGADNLVSQNPWSTLSASENSQTKQASKKKGGAQGANVRIGGNSAVNSSAPAGNILRDGSAAIAIHKASRGILNSSGVPKEPETQDNNVSAKGATAAAQSWTTYENRSNQQRSRKKESGQRNITVTEAVAELEAKSRDVHTSNIVKRSATWAQWCRRMEDARVDADTQYVDTENGDASVSFIEVFLRSNVLEEVVKSSVQNPMADETELQYLFSLTLYGDSHFHERLAKGLRNVGEFFQSCSQPAPQTFVDKIASLISSLKVSPATRAKRVDNMSLQKLEEQISMNVSKLNALSKPDTPLGTEAKCKTTLELLTLVDQKQRLLSRGIHGLKTVDSAHIAAITGELLFVIGSMRGPLLQSKSFAQQQYNVFQSKLKAALAGDDAEYLRVIEIDRSFEDEITKLRSKEDDLRRQLELVAQEISAVQQKQRQHKSQSAKILSVYNERMKAFQGEDGKVLAIHQAAEKNLQLCQTCCDFVEEIRDKAAPILRDESENFQHALYVTRRQALAYLTLYLEASKENADLVSRRQKFCHEKVEAMRREQREALDLGLADLAADLGASICKLEQQHDRVLKQVKGPDVNFQLVQRLYQACSESLSSSQSGTKINSALLGEIVSEEEEQLQDVRSLLAEMGHSF